MNSDVFQMVITLLGGLALFIYGMNLMSDGLQKAAGEKMQKVLALLTKNPILGVLAGTVCTAVLQSSSATTVMVLGFVSAGLMKLPQAISIILGANIGTTITAQLIAFQIGDYAWLFVAIGFILYFFIKKEIITNIGQTTFAFGMLFVGINIMGEAMKPLASSPFFIDLMMQVQDIPILGVLLGTGMTVLVQSSSATIAVLQNLASTAAADGVSSIIGLTGALPILFGDNIGTTITALLASIGGTINAKRTAAAHIIFNITGTFIFIWFIPLYADFIQFISPKGAEVDVIARQIANAHMCFNLFNTLLWLPFIGILVKIVTKMVPGKDTDRLPSEPVYLDDNVLERPFAAIHLAMKELSRLAGFASQMLVAAKKAFLGNSINEVKNVLELEKSVNELQKKIVSYMASISSTDTVTEKQAAQLSGLMHVAADIEHVGDYCENIAVFAEEKTKNKYEFSDAACAEIYECFDHAARMLRDSIEALETGDYRVAKGVKEQEEQLNHIEVLLRKQHMKRISEKKCSPEFTVIYTDVIHNIERIGDCCDNIANAVLDNVNFKASDSSN